jgi:hypothetical protein
MTAVPRRYLFGPVTPAFADQSLHEPRRAGACLAFGAEEGLDLRVGPQDTWEQVCARLPAGWQPGVVALWLPYTHVPAALWSAPVPLVGLATDYNLLWHGYRRCLPWCDLVLTDAPGVEALARDGVADARPANLFGCDRLFLEGPAPEGERDIDVLFVGNLNAAVQRERLPWLARLAGRWHVVIRTGVHGPDYRALLPRAPAGVQPQHPRRVQPPRLRGGRLRGPALPGGREPRDGRRPGRPPGAHPLH